MSIEEKLDKILEILDEKKEVDTQMNIDELIEFMQFRYKKSTIYSMVCLGKIPHSKKPLRFDKNEILTWIKNKQNDTTTI
jgi:predicted DNA-binding transcriptional regulator AlpA